MKSLRLVSACVLAACFGNSSGAFAQDVYQNVFQSVDRTRLVQLLKDMTGANPVTVGTQTFSIRDRYLPASKANFRLYWTQYFEQLGMQVTPLTFDSDVSSLEQQGHDLEAVLPGQSSDSVVIIVHYDSMGPHGSDNPAVDDDMTGMATMMETARILSQMRTQLHYTVRFVASDYEEWGGLEGARYYAQYIQHLAASQNFHIAAAIDDEQSGWMEGARTIDYFDCGGATNSTTLGNLFAATAHQYSTMATKHGCMGENSDHYAMWEIGVPTVVFSEHDPFNNPHFDHAGGDTLARINQDYYFSIAQVGVTFAARVVGIGANQFNLDDLAIGGDAPDQGTEF